MAPEVLHIGFSKCASTYLRALFRAHSRIHLVFKSNFFTPFIRTGMSFEEYQALFSTDSRMVNIESDEHLVLPGVHPDLGVRTTQLETFEKVADDIRAHLPQVKIILVIRNQASLLVARYSEYLITGGSLGFERFAAEMINARGNGNAHYHNYYARILELLAERFPKEQVLVLLQEDMKRDPAGTLQRLSHFLSLESPFSAVTGLRSERRSLSRAGMRLLRRLNAMMVRRSSIGGMPPETRIPSFIYSNVVRIVRLLDFYVLCRFSPASSAVLTRQVRDDVVAEFRADNLRLQEMLRLDLDELGYLK